ncbi:MAG: glycosyltransferase family 9 protein [Myxococcota bacterium]
MPHFLLRTPDHLGDAIMALPAMRSISELGPCSVIGPAWADRLTVDFATKQLAKHDIAVLFKPSFSAAWKARRIPERVGFATDMRRLLLTRIVEMPEGHRRTQYAAISHALGATNPPAPSFQPTPIERDQAPSIDPHAVLLTPISRSQATVGWSGFRALADTLGDRAVFAAGPGECEALAAIAGPHRTLPPLSIGEFAAVAQQAASVVSNDSGLSHLASAARNAANRDPRTVHVIFGSTDPNHTGAWGCTPHKLPDLDCQPCYKKTCHIERKHPPCLTVPVHQIAEAIV